MGHRADTLRRRLAERSTNDFGKAPGDVDAVLSWVGAFERNHEEIGAVMVDATRPLTQVVEAVLAAAGAAGPGYGAGMVVKSWSEVGALYGRPMVVVDSDGAAGPVGDLPCVVVGLDRGEPLPWADVVVAAEAAVARLEEAVGRNPQAATTLVQVLRAGRNGTLEDALTIESLAYGMLQAGPEHQRWLAEQAGRAVKPATFPEPVGLERTGDTLVVTLQRPEVRNAVDVGIRDGLVQAFELVASDPSIERVELRGAGPDFSAGGDLSEFGTKPDPVTGHLVRATRSPARALAGCADRTTAYVHGASVGAGIELAALAHRVVATPDATFRLPEVALGLIPGAGGTATIPRRIGPQRTAWMALTGDVIDAETALAWGLIDQIVAMGEIVPVER